MAKKKTETSVAVVHEHTPVPRDTSAEALIAQAIDKNVSVEALERLLAMRRELKAEHAKEEYDRAMAQFQAECPIIKKTRAVKTDTGAVAYKYAPIESVVYQTRGFIQKNGFSYTTRMVLSEKSVKAIVRVTHHAGHSEDTEMEVPFGSKTKIMSDSQVVAAAQTFAKRYAFLNAFGIMTGDEDVDGKTQADNADPNAAALEKAKRMVLSSKNVDALLEYQETLATKKGSFSDEQKKELLEIVKQRIEALKLA